MSAPTETDSRNIDRSERDMTITAPPAGSDVDTLPGFRHEYVDVHGTTIHAVVGGAGPLVVLLHGWPFTWLAWRALMPQLADAGFTVLAPDLRGIGDSGKPDSGYTKQNVAEDIHQVVETLGFDSIRLVGMDIGTMVAYAYAALYPTQVTHLVLSESVLPGFGLEELMNPATGGYWHFGFQAQVDLAAWLTEGKEAGYLAPTLQMMSQGGGLSEQDSAEIVAHYAAPGGMRGGFQHYGTLIEDGRANRVSGQTPLPMPVLVLNGERGLPQQQLLDGVEKAAVNVSSDLVPGGGHTYAADNPTWTAERLSHFFSQDS